MQNSDLQTLNHIFCPIDSKLSTVHSNQARVDSTNFTHDVTFFASELLHDSSKTIA